jgi:hypothetical protein
MERELNLNFPQNDQPMTDRKSMSQLHTDTVYTVFRRNDGYVNAIASGSIELAKDRLRPYSNTSFEILLHTTRWTEAHALIVSERETSTS